jgi:capping protein beta
LKQSPLQFLPFDLLEDVGNDQEEEEKPFLLCSYNQVQSGTYRSPYTSRLFTVKADGKAGQIAAPKSVPEDEKDIRNLERAANEVWWPYVQMYYGWEGIGSAFLKRGKGSTFGGIFGLHKKSDDNGTWDCVHLVQVDEPKNGTCNYRLDSAVLMSIRPYEGATISSSLTKETVKSLKVRASSVAGSHLENLGKIMEEVEMEFRSRLERIHVPQSLETMEAVYKVNRDSITAAAIIGIDEKEEPMNLTGMGVGRSMIGEIASQANQRTSTGSAFLESMKAQQKARETQMKEQSQDYYSEMKSTLKKTTLSPTPVAKKAPIIPVSPEFVGKAGLRKTTVPPKLPVAPASPTPEFANFRNKLKKAGSKK